MSNTDSFIDEVTEEVRRDRLFALMRKYGWIAVVAVLALVGGAGWNEYTKARDAAQAEAAGDAITAALGQSEAADRASALAEAEAAGTLAGETRVVAAFLKAGELYDAGQTDAALAALAPLASDAVLDPVYRDLAILKTAMIGAGTLAPEQRIEMLAGIAAVGAPYQLLAEEQIAAAQIELGEIDAAIEGLRALAADANATSGLRRRAQQMIVALGGDPEAE